MRKSVCLLIVSSFLALTVWGQGRRADSRAQEHAAAPALDPELTPYEYPYPVGFYDFDTRGQRLRMAYMDVAPAKPNSHAVVLLHGKNFSGPYWAPTIRALAAEGYRVVAPDQIGFGKSSKPAAYQFSFHAPAANSPATGVIT